MAHTRSIAERLATDVPNGGDLDAIDEILTADHVDHDPTLPSLPPGAKGVRQRVTAFMSGPPDAEVPPDEVVVAGPFVIARWTWVGTGTGRIGEARVAADTLGLIVRLGVVELPAPALA